MTAVVNVPKLEIINGKFHLAESFRYTFPDRKYIVIPKGYQTNFASIPSVFRWLISPVDQDIVVAAIVHDWLVAEFGEVYTPLNYRHPRAIMSETNDPAAPKADWVDWNQAVAIMRTIMELEGAPTWKRQAVYLAVRAYGVFK